MTLAGCLGGGGGDEPHVIKGDVATVYTSLPRHGVSLPAAEQVLSGERRALERPPRPRRRFPDQARELPATDERDHPWDPGLVAANANRAADDPTAIAYLGELDYGATAVSLPITNDAGLLQVSPLDGLTSLTQRPPGRPRAGPERYYPSGSRSFVRIGPDRPERGQRDRRAAAGHGCHALRDRLRPRDLRPRARGAGRRAGQATQGLTPVAPEEYRGQVDEIPGIAASSPRRARTRSSSSAVAGRGTDPDVRRDRRRRCPACRCTPRAGCWRCRSSPLPPGPEQIEAFGPALVPRARGLRAPCASCSTPWRGRPRPPPRDRRRPPPRRRCADPPVALYEPDEHGHFAKAGR